ncbi:MAG: IS481 family transposase [Microcella pacifica]|uniref:IS481 family transposase n=1 Tax=Microcella pacifica TaxID=2591847 RepID=UPI0033157D91
MSKARLIITAVTVQGLSQAEAARTYGVSKGWVSKLIARWRVEGEAAFEPHSRRPRTTPGALPAETVELILELRKQLTARGLDAGAHTIAWHLQHHHDRVVSPATIWRTLKRAGLIEPEPKKRPRSSYMRFQAALPNQCWQSDFTHYRLADGTNAEILTWLDDCTRYAISVTAHAAVTTPIVVATFRASTEKHGTPASTLTDNGMVFTVRHSGFGRRGGRNAFETELRDRNIVQKNGSPSHPQTQGKVERFQQTMKNWLRAHDPQPRSLEELQQLLDQFAEEYNERRPHRALPHHSTPAARYFALPKATPTAGARDADNHTRVRHDRVDTTGCITLRVAGKMHHIGISRTHSGTHVLVLVNDLEVTVINAATGEVLRELTIDTRRDYQPTGRPKGPQKRQKPPNP